MGGYTGMGSELGVESGEGTGGRRRENLCLVYGISKKFLNKKN